MELGEEDLTESVEARRQGDEWRCRRKATRFGLKYVMRREDTRKRKEKSSRGKPRQRDLKKRDNGCSFH